MSTSTYSVALSSYYYYIATLSHRRIVALSHCQIIRLSHYRIVALLSCCHIVKLSHCRIIVVLPYYRIIILSHCYCRITTLLTHFARILFYPCVILPVYYFACVLFCPYAKTHFVCISIVILLVYNNSQFNFIKITLPKGRTGYRIYR